MNSGGSIDCSEFRIAFFSFRLCEPSESAKSGWNVFPVVGEVTEEGDIKKATLTLKMNFHEYRKEKIPFEIVLEAEGVFTEQGLHKDDFARMIKVQGAAGLVPRVRSIVNGFLNKAGIITGMRQ